MLVRREATQGVTIVDLFLTFLAFAGAAAAFTWSLLALFQDRETLALVFAVGGVWLAAWSGHRAVR